MNTNVWVDFQICISVPLTANNFSFGAIIFGTRKTPTQKILTWMIPPGQFPPGKPHQRKILTQDNSYPENSHPG